MKGRQTAMVLGAFVSALGTQALWADDNRAVPRGGGSSGGGHSSSGSSHHSSGSGSSGSSSSDSSSGSSHHSRPPQTDAQRRKPTPGTGSGYRYGHGGHRGGYGGYYGGSGYGYPYWNYGYYWSPWYYPSYGGWYGGYGHYGYGPSYGYGYSRGYSNAGSVRVMVEPRKTKVYVDDYYAGVADDFDGMFQRLNLSTGRHDISLRLDGFETHRVKLYVPAAGTIKIKHEMVRGASDKVSESTVGEPVPEPRYAREPDDDDYENSREHRDETRPDNRGERGTVRLDVSPADASIYVDGVFRGTGSDLRKVTLPEGTHRLEVVRPGYRTLERDVEVRAGETEEVDIDLLRS